MTVLPHPPLSFLIRFFEKDQQKACETAQIDTAERRRIFGEMITSGACGSEYGAQMLMSVFPDQY
ncbi:hypothetical protein [uncultured Roseibium sp.]|uniref:hypothetical protein n=1 Tax=uncultured Roseibium sp. TaxID=1936171 RepID=UPI00261BDB2A|nr:hypothetical protein [uncultured Roseibium sp.]